MLTSFRIPNLLHKTRRLIAFVSLFILGSYISGATADVNGLLDLSLEDLAQTPVSLVSRKAEAPFGLPAAVSVITAKELYHSSTFNLAEALRLVPGFHVGRIDANKWAVSARGFNGRYANKVLGLIDGRSIYTTATAAGVFWEMQDILLADLDRVEVIRGPGASLWGANAVNGVVNLVSKEAIATQGGHLRLGIGTEDQLLQGRYGGRINEQTYYRAYGHFGHRDDLKSKSDIAANDSWDSWKMGTRLDWRPAVRDHITLVADLQQGDMAQTALLFSPEAPYSDFDQHRIQFSSISTSWRWQREVSDRSDFSLFSYYEKLERRGPPIGELSDIWNSEFQHRISLGNRHELLWGLQYRLTAIERMNQTFTASFSPRTRQLSLFGGFAQDDISLVTNRLRLILGAKLEHNEFTGLEFQPNARLAWTPTARHALWAATSRAVRSSSSGENDVRLLLGVLPPVEGALPVFLGLVGNPDFRAETMHAFEAGYRYRYGGLLSLDVATFANDYTDLFAVEITPLMRFDDHVLRAVTPENQISGRSYGVEISGNYKWSNSWSLNTAYAFFHLKLKSPEASSGLHGDQEKNTPRHIFTLALQGLNILGTDLNATLRRVGPVLVNTTNIPAYSELDLYVNRLVADQTSISLALQNMLHSSHAEYSTRLLTVPLMQVQRAFTLTLVREF